MSDYDEAAPGYDKRFTRPIDGWEDEHLADLLRPAVAGRDVLDLGCGTGWVADHCSPGRYTGADCSAGMLAELARKHPGAETVKVAVGSRGWTAMLPPGRPFVVTATWSLEYLGDLAELLAALRMITAPGGLLVLHGSMPRGHRRAHFSVKEAPWEAIGPPQVRYASLAAGLRPPDCTGTSALPDGLAHLGRLAWRAALAAPAGMHYAALWTWRLP